MLSFQGLQCFLTVGHGIGAGFKRWVSGTFDNKTTKDLMARGRPSYTCAKPNGTLENFNRVLSRRAKHASRISATTSSIPFGLVGGQIPAGVCIEGESMAPATAPVASASSNGPFVGSLKSNKYHYPSCNEAKKISAANLVTFAISEEALAARYVPCGG